jgi:asparagine synthase (glutamine-hydrolysing)
MCGITGFIDFTGKTDKQILAGMTDALIHRGPDDSGYEILNEANCSIGLGFRRLSIIDLSPLGHQPMFSDDRLLAIIFNGEIYNYKEIRAELEKENFHFRSNSDTEVILNAYTRWGIGCIKKFIGMFAIALFDGRVKKFYLIRDRAGVKPLFYHWNNSQFLFASELKALHKHPQFRKELNHDALGLYFQHAYIPAPHCIFQNTFKLLPGHYLEFDLTDKKFSLTKYWDVNDCYNQPALSISFDDALNETEKILTDAFQYRLVADVPVGVFLSGGYDSTAVTALLQKNRTDKIKTFTIGFHEEKFNEAVHAKKVAKHLGTEHTEYHCTYSDAFEIIPRLPEIYDEPFGDSSGIPTLLVSRIARQYVKVALSADAGDEIFCGYTKYIKGKKYLKLAHRFPDLFLKMAGNFLKLFSSESSGIGYPDKRKRLMNLLMNTNPAFATRMISQIMIWEEVQPMFRGKLNYLPSFHDDEMALSSSAPAINHFLAADYKTYLVDDILQKVDRATMAVSLEGREPFLDQRIVEFAARLPESFKLNNGVSKHILRQIVHRYVPEKIMQRPKMGFGVPVETWCRSELKHLLTDYISEERIRSEGIFDAPKISLMLKKYFAHGKIDFQRIWHLLMFEMWRERWMK